MGKEYIQKTLKMYHFRRPSFFEGMARVLDLGNSIHLYSHYTDGQKEDYEAIKSDWAIIGMDMKQAMSEYNAHGSKPR